jgi:predicted MFS family arabinose efflux permease
MGTLVLMALASVVGALAPRFSLFAAAMIAYGVIKMVFDPTISAYLADLIPYERRGRAVGIMELSWAGALLIAAPITGWLLGTSGLQSVFIMLGAGCLVALAAIYRFLPADHPSPGAAPRGITPRATWRALRSSPVTFYALAHLLLRVVANEIFFINYGAYMETTFGLELTALGIVTVVVAIAEVCGEFAVIGFADRFGKRRMTLLGTGISSVGYLLLPLLSFSLPLTLALVFMIFFTLEAAIVASLPLFQEILPDSRAIMMSAYTGVSALGRLLGAMLGGWLYLTLGNFTVMSVIATVIALVSWFLVWRFMHEKATVSEG